jgi:hypothetical protein
MIDIILSTLGKQALQLAIQEGWRAASAHWSLDSKMGDVNRAYNKVRGELADVGLLADGVYLDDIELEVALLPSFGEAGFVYEATGWWQRLIGYQEGVIYLPRDLPASAYVPGGTLTDTIRHEYAHAWHWIEPDFFERPWYSKAFGIPYNETSTTPAEEWHWSKERSRKFQSALNSCRNDRERLALYRKNLRDDFVSEYATTLSCEDFAETFMYYLRYRNSLDRFASRPGVYKKLLAIQKAVATASRELGLQ